MLIHISNIELTDLLEFEMYIQIKSLGERCLKYKKLAKDCRDIDDIDYYNFVSEELSFLVYFFRDYIENRDTSWVTIGYISLLEDYNEKLRKNLAQCQAKLRSDKQNTSLILQVETLEYKYLNNLETIKQSKLCIGVK
jgi:hypothetical protein